MQVDMPVPGMLRDRKSQSKTVEFDAEGEVAEDPRASNSGLEKNVILPPKTGALPARNVAKVKYEISYEPTIDFQGDVC